jgi:hypothetical protein
LFKGGVRGALVNNFIYNPGQRAIHYNLQELEWGDIAPLPGRMTAIGNVLRAGPSTPVGAPMFMIGGEGDLELYNHDNIAVDRFGAPSPMMGTYTTGTTKIVEVDNPLDLPDGLVVLSAQEVERRVLPEVGARPWDRDANDVRVLADVAEGRGTIIDTQEEVGGYPVMAETRRSFDPSLWDLDTMEPASPEALDSASKARGT